MPRTNPMTIAEYRPIFSRICGELDAGDRKVLLEEIGERGKRDLHFFAVVIMGCTVMSPSTGIHGRVCSFLQSPDPCRKQLEMFRGGLKSTLGTVAWNVQAVARDPSEHRLIMSATHPLAKSFLRDIKQVVLSKTFRRVYPHLRPVKTQWNQSEAAVHVVGQRRESREPTWGTGAIDVALTGTHWTAITYDDLVVPENVENKEMADKVTTRFKQLRPLLDTWGTPELIVNTVYESFDLYGWLRRARGGWFQRLSIPVVGADGEPAWPEEYPAARIEELRSLDLKMFMSQYMLDARPVGLRVFRAEDIRYWRRPEEAEDPLWREMPESQRPRAMRLQDMTLYMGWDPSTGVDGGDESAFAVVGIDKFGNFYVVDVIHGLYSMSDQMDLFFMLHDYYARCHPQGISMTSVEMAGPFASMEASLRSEMEVRAQEARKAGKPEVWPWVEKAQLHNQNKIARIRMVLGTKYQNGRVYHHHLMCGGPVDQQFIELPGSADDCCDAVSHAVDLAQQHGAYGTVEPEKAKVHAYGSFGKHERIGLTLAQMGDASIDEKLAGLRKAVGHAGLF